MSLLRHNGIKLFLLPKSRAEEWEDSFIGDLSDESLEVGGLFCALWDVVIGEDCILQVVGFVHKGVKELCRMRDTTYDKDGHTRPGDTEYEGFVGAMDGAPCFCYFTLRTAKLAENWRELGEIVWKCVIVSKDAPVAVNVKIGTDHLQFRSCLPNMG